MDEESYADDDLYGITRNNNDGEENSLTDIEKYTIVDT